MKSSTVYNLLATLALVLSTAWVIAWLAGLVEGEGSWPVRLGAFGVGVALAGGAAALLFHSAKQKLPTGLSALEQQAVKELEDLSTIESQLAKVKSSATDLENSEIFIHEEIQRSAASRTPEGASLTKQTLLRGLEEIGEPEETRKRSHIFQLKRPEK